MQQGDSLLREAAVIGCPVSFIDLMTVNVYADRTTLAGVRLRRRSLRGEEIEVATLVRLRDVRRVQGAVPARIAGRWGSPGRPAPGQLRRGYVQLQLPLFDVERDQVAVPYECQRAARVRLGGDVQHAGAVTGTGHPRVGDPHHVPYPLLEQPVGDRQHAVL